MITSSSPREDFRSAAAAMGLSLAVTFPAEGLDPYQEAWSNANRSVVVQYVEKHNLGVEFFYIYGDPTHGAYVMSSLVQDLQYLNPENVMYDALHALSADDRVTASNRLAVAETDFNPEVFDLLKRFTTDADEVLRTAATRALGYLRWPEARLLLEKLAAEDPSEWVRNAARLGIGDLDRDALSKST